MPQRIQRLRTRGARIGAAIYVGRPSIWGNPWLPERHRQSGHWLVHGPGRESLAGLQPCGNQAGAHMLAVRIFRELAEPAIRADAAPWWVIRQNADIRTAEDWLRPLRGRDLACWCPITLPDGEPCACHADVLLEWAATF